MRPTCLLMVQLVVQLIGAPRVTVEVPVPVTVGRDLTTTHCTLTHPVLTPALTLTSPLRAAWL